jgi:hypothetical protein
LSAEPAGQANGADPRDGAAGYAEAYAYAGAEAYADAEAYAEVIRDIASGARLHYDNEGSSDPDLDLLLGDQRYASGLAKLAALGDLEETARLADLISRVAQLHAEGERAAARGLLEAAERRLGAAPQE